MELFNNYRANSSPSLKGGASLASEQERSFGEIHYQGMDPLVRLKIKGVSNHELRCVLLGLWRRLDADDRADFIQELTHYCGRPDEELPPLAQAIAFGETDE